MASFEGQSTDGENNRAPLKVGKPGDSTKKISSKSAQEIAKENPVAGDKAGTPQASTAVYDGQSGG
jgi:hypothetical protein